MVHHNSLWAKNETQKSSSKCSSMYTGAAGVRCVHIAQNAYSAFPSALLYSILLSYILATEHGFCAMGSIRGLWSCDRDQRFFFWILLDSIERNELYVKYMWKEDIWNYELWKDFRLINKDNFLVHHNHVYIHHSIDLFTLIQTVYKARGCVEIRPLFQIDWWLRLYFNSTRLLVYCVDGFFNFFKKCYDY